MPEINQILNKIQTCQSKLHVFKIRNKKYVYNNDKTLILRVGERLSRAFDGQASSIKLNTASQQLLFSLDNLGYFEKQEPNVLSPTFRRCHLYLDYSNKCNLNCSYCYVQKDNTYQSSPDKAIDLIKSFVEQHSNSFDEFVIDFCCFGEPLIFFEDMQLIKARLAQLSKELNKKIDLTFTTNAVLMSDAVADYFIKTKQQFGVSFDGVPSQHNSNRSNSYNKVACALARYRNKLEQKNFKYLWASAVINRSPEDLVAILKRTVDCGFEAVILKPTRQLERTAELLILKESYWKLVLFLIKKYRNGDIKYLSAILNTSDYFGKYIRSLIRNERTLWRCGAGRHLFFINYHGEVSPCIQFHGNSFLKLGQVRGELDGNVMTHLERMECSECWAKSLCGGTCYYLSKFYPKDCVFSCELKKTLIEYAVYLTDQISIIDAELFRKLNKLILVKEKFFLGTGD